ncbi:conserved Plasmodium protein, unknown function [Plasmodium sp. gorilla clade G2]|uniref:conserved Plasmodium protein, unknown function n=1 Tax=Plasmodium sp. gorilla clade G2 TaxID=880535 RepID=UPI000D209485|nr:conserved Plasmodium protein, unknown function [Plasmodium sp. gorilla clade G2]SOV15447.1 conserved Plasmodium protein, unknown function [Plasmodium sp. gorilla clade G2]
MFFSNNIKEINNNGLIFTTIERINIKDLLKIAEENEERNKNDRIIDYIYNLNNKKCLIKLGKLLKSHLINSQIVITNFCDRSNELFNSKYIYENIINNKRSYYIQNLYLSSLFSTDYINYIIKKYDQVMVSYNCKYDNKIYINNNILYLCINDLTKLRLINHKNLYKDKYLLNHIVSIDICNHKQNKDIIQYNNINHTNKSVNNNIPNESENIKLLNKKYIQNENHNNDNNKEKIGGKLREIYENFFTNLYTYPVDLLCIYNNCDENFIRILKSILVNNKSINVQIYPLYMKYHEFSYKLCGALFSRDTEKEKEKISTTFFYNMSADSKNNATINNYNNYNNNYYNSTYSFMKDQYNNTIPNEINIKQVDDVYNDIFSNSSIIQQNNNKIIQNNYRINDKDRNEYSNKFNQELNQKHNIYSSHFYNDKNVNNSNVYISKNKMDDIFFYELNMEYIEKEILEKYSCDHNKINKNENINSNINNNHDASFLCHHQNHNNVINFHDIYNNNSNNNNDDDKKNKNKIHKFNDKKFYVNYNSSSSSDINISLTQNGDYKIINTPKEKKKKKLKNDDIISNEKKKKDEYEYETYKKKKVQSVLKFLQNYKNSYYINNEHILKKECLYDIIDNMKNMKDFYIKQDHFDNEDENYNNFILYFMEYIGRILLDIKLCCKQNTNMLVKKKKQFYQIQKIIFNNGLIDIQNIQNLSNFLIHTLIKKENNNDSKLHYVLTIYGQDNNFINYDRYLQEVSNQTCIHICFFSSKGDIYIMILDTQNRIL